MFDSPVMYNLASTPHVPGFRFQRPEGFPRLLLAMHLAGRKERTVLGPNPVSYDLPANTLTLTEPEVGYSFVVLEKSYEMWCFLEVTEWPRFWANWQPTAPGDWLLHFGDSDHRGAIREGLRQCQVDFERGPDGLALATNALRRVLLLADEVATGRDGPWLDPRVAAAVAFLREHLTAPISVTDLAQEVHMSESHLAHLFRQQVGESPMRYLERCRMAEASRRLLATNQQIQEIAEAVGFPNPFHFSQRFRAVMGKSPRAFRNAGGA